MRARCIPQWYGSNFPGDGGLSVMDFVPQELKIPKSESDPPRSVARSATAHSKEVVVMSVYDKLKDLASIEGFEGAGVFTPTGETLGVLDGDGVSKKMLAIGVLANSVLMNAQKVSLDIGAGRGQLVHVETDSGIQILVKCLNEGDDPLKSQPGKAHIHMVLMLKDESNIGLAKMKLDAVIGKLARDFRM